MELTFIDIKNYLTKFGKYKKFDLCLCGLKTREGYWQKEMVFTPPHIILYLFSALI